MVAGCMRNDGHSGSPDLWSVYLATDDARASIDPAVANRGQVIVPPMAVMELGTIAVVTDPGQAGIGVWQPGLHKGFGTSGELGTPTWFELHTRDYQASVRFYRDVFKWDVHVASDTPEDTPVRTLGTSRRSHRSALQARRRNVTSPRGRAAPRFRSVPWFAPRRDGRSWGR
jgi:hypothetical protein